MRGRDPSGGSGGVNTPHVAGLTRQDHVVAKCALVVERNPGVVRSTAVACAVCQRRKQRDGVGGESTGIHLINKIA